MTTNTAIDHARDHGREDALLTAPLLSYRDFLPYSHALDIPAVRNAALRIEAIQTREYRAYVEGYSDYAF